MADASTYKELRIPKGGAKAFYEALTAMNDKTAPGKKNKLEAKKKAPASKKNK